MIKPRHAQIEAFAAELHSLPGVTAPAVSGECQPKDINPSKLPKDAEPTRDIRLSLASHGHDGS